MQDRGLAAYIAELIGTLLLTFAIGMVVSLFVATGASSATASARAATTPSARTSTASRGRVPNVFGKISIPS